MRLLLVSPYLPHRAVGHGGGMATYGLAIALARHHQVTLLCFQRSHESASLAADLAGFGVRVETVSFRSGADRGPARLRLVLDRAACALRAVANGRPYLVERYTRATMGRRLLQLLQELRPHAVQVEYEFMAPYARLARQALRDRPQLWPDDREAGSPRPPTVSLNTHEVGVVPRLRRVVSARGAWDRLRRAGELSTWARYEADSARWADLVVCVTDQDRAVLQALSGAPDLVTLPLGVDASALAGVTGALAAPRRLLFVGSFDHAPNRDAALLLVNRIFPRVRQRCPDVVLEIAGRNPPAALRAAASALPAGAVELLGFVPELDPLFERAWLFVAPLFAGGGIKIKILEAMGRGVPVLSTPVGFEGIDARPGQDAAVGHTPEDVAEQACALLESPGELRRMGAAGRRLVHERYSWDAIASRLVRQLQGT
jgi:glycosyltransferase involved in cell wall biosynthesis